MFDSALYLCPAWGVKLEKRLDVCTQGKRSSKITLSVYHTRTINIRAHLRAQLRVLVSDALIDNWIFELPLQNHSLVITTPFSVSARSTRTFCGFRPILDLAANDLPRVFHRRRYIQF